MARPRVIDQQQIVRAALDVLDDVGPDRFTLSGIAGRLGVTTPALYNHFNDKSEILRETARHVFDTPNVPSSEDYAPAQFEEYIVDRCLTSFRQASRHPAVAVLLLAHIPPTLVEAGFWEITRLMSAAGVSEEDRLLIFEGIQKLVWGWVLVLHVFDRADPSMEGSLVSGLTGLPAAAALEGSVRALIRGVLAGTADARPTAS